MSARPVILVPRPANAMDVNLFTKENSFFTYYILRPEKKSEFCCQKVDIYGYLDESSSFFYDSWDTYISLFFCSELGYSRFIIVE